MLPAELLLGAGLAGGACDRLRGEGRAGLGLELLRVQFPHTDRARPYICTPPPCSAIEKPSASKLRFKTNFKPYANTPTLAFKAQHHAHSLVEHERGSVMCSKIPALHLRHAVLQAPDF